MRRIIAIILLLACIPAVSACNSQSKAINNPVNYYYQSTKVDYTSPDGMIASEVRDAGQHRQDYPYLIEQYLNGPINSDYTTPFPAGTVLEEFELEENLAHVTLSAHITTLSSADIMFACVCLTRTVTELTGVRSVQIGITGGTINGNSTITLTPNSFVLWNGR